MQKLVTPINLKIIAAVFGIAFISVIAAVVYAKLSQQNYLSYTQNQIVSQKTQIKEKYASYFASGITARTWMEYAMDVVKHEKLFDTEAARLYAYVSSVYADVYNKTNSTAEASVAVQLLINTFYPNEKSRTDEIAFACSENIALGNDAQQILTSYLQRALSDGLNDANSDYSSPIGEDKWKQSDLPAATPNAGSWKRWILSGNDYQVAFPPYLGSAEEAKELQKIEKAVLQSDPNWNYQISYWDGGLGSEKITGIWQNNMYQKTKNAKLSEKDYANIQKTLAQGTADALAEAWKVKYHYWTARPNTRIANIQTKVVTPNTPAYVNSHAVVSTVSAQILTKAFPNLQQQWDTDAKQATLSRLYAGVNFDIDNVEGTKLGEQIATDILKITHIDSFELSQPVTTQNESPTVLDTHKISTQDEPHSYSDNEVVKKDILVLSNSNYDKKFLVIADQAYRADLQINPGWQVSNINTDSVWSFAMSPQILQSKYIVAFEPTVNKFFVYDIGDKQFKYLLTNPHDFVLANSLYQKNDNVIGYYFVPEGNFELTNNSAVIHKDRAYIVKREINIDTLEYTDTQLAYPKNILNKQYQYSINFTNNSILLTGTNQVKGIYTSLRENNGQLENIYQAAFNFVTPNRDLFTENQQTSSYTVKYNKKLDQTRQATIIETASGKEITNELLAKYQKASVLGSTNNFIYVINQTNNAFFNVVVVNKQNNTVDYAFNNENKERSSPGMDKLTFPTYEMNLVAVF